MHTFVSLIEKPLDESTKYKTKISTVANMINLAMISADTDDNLCFHSIHVTKISINAAISHTPFKRCWLVVDHCPDCYRHKMNFVCQLKMTKCDILRFDSKFTVNVMTLYKVHISPGSRKQTWWCRCGRLYLNLSISSNCPRVFSLYINFKALGAACGRTTHVDR